MSQSPAPDPTIVLSDAAVSAGQHLDSDSWNLVYRLPDGWWLESSGWDSEGAAVAAGFDHVAPGLVWSAVKPAR